MRMNRDKLYGGGIVLISVLILIGFLIAFFSPYLAPLLNISAELRWWAIAIPIFLLVILALGISMWIGWTMLTTPPPLPIEEEPSEAPSTDTETK